MGVNATSEALGIIKPKRKQLVGSFMCLDVTVDKAKLLRN